MQSRTGRYHRCQRMRRFRSADANGHEHTQTDNRKRHAYERNCRTSSCTHLIPHGDACERFPWATSAHHLGRRDLIPENTCITIWVRQAGRTAVRNEGTHGKTGSTSPSGSAAVWRPAHAKRTATCTTTYRVGAVSSRVHHHTLGCPDRGRRCFPSLKPGQGART
jgi:hypothetical protein